MRRLIVALPLAVALLAAPSAHGQQPVEHTLAVQGLGEALLPADVGTFQAEVRRTAPTSAAAREAANGRLTAIVSRLRGLGVPRLDITTTALALTRVRTRVRGTRVIRVRYVASGAFSVRVEGAARIGPAIDAAASAGATGIDGPAFSFSQPLQTQARRDAERAALADARTRADAAAATQGQRVAGVQSIDLDPGSGGPLFSSGDQSAAPAKAATPTPVLPGRQTTSSTVRVVFILQPV